MTISPDLLHEALEGRGILGPGQAEAAALVRLAAAVGRLQPEGPSRAARVRMSARFESTLERPRRRRLFVLLGPWIGVGGQPRPLAQRLAAGALLLASVGGGASVASGGAPASAVRGTVDFITNAIANLAPRSNDSGLTLPPVTETPPASPGASATAAATPTPGATVTATTAAPPTPSTVNNSLLPAANTEPPSTAAPVLGLPSSTATPVPQPTATATSTPQPTVSPTATESPTPTPPPAAVGTTTPPTPTGAATATPKPGSTATPEPSPSPSPTVPATPTEDDHKGGDD